MDALLDSTTPDIVPITTMSPEIDTIGSEQT